MRTKAMTATLALAVSLSAHATPETELKPLLDEMIASANAHDSDRFMALYQKTPSLTISFDDLVLTGFDTILAQQKVWWENGKATPTYSELAPTRIQPVSADVAATFQTLEVKAGPNAPPAKRARLTITSVWKRLPEGWRIVLAHESMTR
jgi:ketosteroid isomerase-like protein